MMDNYLLARVKNVFNNRRQITRLVYTYLLIIIHVNLRQMIRMVTTTTVCVFNYVRLEGTYIIHVYLTFIHGL